MDDPHRAFAPPRDGSWVLVGGQMVLLHGLERNVPAPRISSDIDAGIDVRMNRRGVRTMVNVLETLGFESAGVSPEGIAHRFHKSVTPSGARKTRDGDPSGGPVGQVVVDLLVPEGFAPKTDVTTRGGRAFPVPGLTQALRRSELVPVSYADSTGWIPRPTLLGAIVAKAAAATTDPIDRDRHLVDLAFLCGLVEDPIMQAREAEKGDRRRLKAATRLLPEDHLAWIEGSDDPVEARIALAILANSQ